MANLHQVLREGNRVNSSARSSIVIAIMILVVTVLIWAGVHNARSRRLEMQQNQEARAILVPDAASRAGADSGGPDGMTPKLQGKPAPAFTLVDLDGKKVSLADFKGKPVLVNFWATWCGPCKLEMPWMQEFSQKYAAQGLIILGIAADDASKSIIASTTHKLGVTYPVLLKQDATLDAYGGVNYLPESFYVDRTGKIMVETAGMNDGQGGKDEIEANIKKLIATTAQ